jgi:group II intron reverse transcriptase/maturase/CRISPR-associated endonuclease Cas1
MDVVITKYKMSKKPTYNQLCNRNTLWEAWLDVKAKKSFGGIDNISIQHFEQYQDQYLEEIIHELKSKTYIPQPYQKVKIYKNESESRTLGLLTVKDKIIQSALKILIEPAFEKKFLNVSYGYRPQSGPIKAINRVKHIIQHEKPSWMIECDIHNFFDNITHAILKELLHPHIQDKELIEIILLCIKMGNVDAQGRWLDNPKGLPQGAILSPLLSNLYLNELDKFIVNQKISYVRYADDFVILSKHKKDAERILIETEKFLIEQLKLELNPEHKIISMNESFNFLGISFNKTNLFLSEKKIEKLKAKISASLVFNSSKISIKHSETIQGIRQYYGKLIPPQKLIPLDDHIIHTSKEILSINKVLSKSLMMIRSVLSELEFITDIYSKNKSTHIEQIAREIRKKPISESKEIDQLVEKRKREYQKLESSKMELIISTYGVYLGKSKKGILIKKADNTKETISPINLRHIIILNSGVTFSSDFVHYCIEYNIAIDFFSRTGKHYASIHRPQEANRQFWLDQIKAIENQKGKAIALQLVQSKIKNQINLLKYFNKYHKHTDQDFANTFLVNIEKMKKIYLETKIDIADDHQTYSGILFSIEGRAAAIYWDTIVNLIDDDSDFISRTQQGAKDLTNSMLNYGYAILYSRVWDALVRVKLNPYISYLHAHQDGKPTLVFDFIESFRQQAVDRVVIALLQKGEKFKIEDGLLDEESRKKLSQNILERLHRYELYRGERRRFSEIIKIQARHLANYISGEDPSFKPYISKW